MSNDIKVFKMINGEEIIGQVFIAFGDHFEIKEPAQIVLQRDPKSGGVGVAIAPYMPYADGNVDIYKSAIGSSCIPSKDLVNEYNRIFGAGIIVPPAQSIIAPV